MQGNNPSKEELDRLQITFGSLKAETDNLLETEPELFVHTSVYRRARDAERCLLVGGKGAGKTALLQGYWLENAGKYLTRADIEADNLPMEVLYSFFYTATESRLRKAGSTIPRISDLPEFVDTLKLSVFAWKQSLMCAAIYNTANALLIDDNVSLSDTDKKVLRKATRTISRYMGNAVRATGESGSVVVFSLLTYFFMSVQAVIDKVLGTQIEEMAALVAAIFAETTRNLSRSLEKSVDNALPIIRRHLQQQKKRTLITLDKFDDFYDGFYDSSKGRQKMELGANRKDFLTSLLHGLVLSARDLQRDAQFKWVHMLLAVPQDKFLELHLRERADLEHTTVLRLTWTPRELYRYVNKRIAYALGLPLDGAVTPWDQLFPFSVTNCSVREVKEHSFLYIVRHSLWRPRQIQMYLNAIFDLMESERCAGSEELFQKAVKTGAREIINNEFVEEFQTEYPNIKSVLRRFEGLSLKTVDNYSTLCDRIGKTALFEDVSTPDEVILRLYHMGVLGTRTVLQAKHSESTDATITQNHQEVSYRFCYNSPVNNPFSSLSSNVEIVFHPMFFEYLNVKHDARYVVNQLTWDMYEPTGNSEG